MTRGRGSGGAGGGMPVGSLPGISYRRVQGSRSPANGELSRVNRVSYLRYLPGSFSVSGGTVLILMSYIVLVNG